MHCWFSVLLLRRTLMIPLQLESQRYRLVSHPFLWLWNVFNISLTASDRINSNARRIWNQTNESTWLETGGDGLVALFDRVWSVIDMIGMIDVSASLSAQRSTLNIRLGVVSLGRLSDCGSILDSMPMWDSIGSRLVNTHLNPSQSSGILSCQLVTVQLAAHVSISSWMRQDYALGTERRQILYNQND